VVRALATDPEVLGSILGATSFLEVVGVIRGPLSLASTTEDLLERKSSGSGLESREYGSVDPLRWPLSAKIGINFTDNQRSFGRYSSLADWGHAVCFALFLLYTIKYSFGMDESICEI
jgi:hypothetical protein